MGGRLIVRKNGFTLSYANGGGKPLGDGAAEGGARPLRRWTVKTARSNEAFLMGVDFTAVEGVPWAVTLTVPAASMPRLSAAIFHRMLDTWLKRQMRKGF